MITKYIAIILKDKIIDRVCAQSNTLDGCYDQAFKYADAIYGENEGYELLELDNPRSQVLFSKELTDLF
jgi:hypothetical protein